MGVYLDRMEKRLLEGKTPMDEASTQRALKLVREAQQIEKDNKEIKKEIARAKRWRISPSLARLGVVKHPDFCR